MIEDGKLRPPFSSIEGIADTAGEALAEAGQHGPYISRDDIRQRAKVGQSVVDTLYHLGLLGDLPESNQLSIFDIM